MLPFVSAMMSSRAVASRDVELDVPRITPQSIMIWNALASRRRKVIRKQSPSPRRYIRIRISSLGDTGSVRPISLAAAGEDVVDALSGAARLDLPDPARAIYASSVSA